MKSARLALLFLFISVLLIPSCLKKEEKPEIPRRLDSLSVRFIDPYSYADSILSKRVLFVYLEDSTKTFSGIYQNVDYGIGFFILAPLDTVNEVSFLSPVLDGIAEDSEIDTILLNSNKKFIYYNSGNAFIGSRNLEVYQYLFSPIEKKLYSSYSSLQEDGSVIFKFSKNLKDKAMNSIRSFFIDQIGTKFIEDLSDRKIIIDYE